MCCCLILLGIVVSFLFICVMCFGIEFYFDFTKKLRVTIGKIFRQVVMIALLMAGYISIFAFTKCEIIEKCPFVSVINAILLVVIWKMTYEIDCWVFKDIIKQIDVSDAEKSWYSAVSVCAIILVGCIWLRTNKASLYLEMISYAVTIWIGSYFSIQKIQSKNVIKGISNDIKRGLRKLFDKNNLEQWCVYGGVFIMVVLSLMKDISYHKNVFEPFSFGFCIGVALFLALTKVLDIRGKNQKMCEYKIKQRKK